MKFSYNQLKSWLNFQLTPQELADLIYLHITEVESVISEGPWANFVVGEILEIHPHPNADKLQLTKVDVGGTILDIVCGGRNIAVGQKVPVAMIGATLPDGTVIRSALIRGERSNGMLCSRAELGLTGDASGIMILESSRTPGAPLTEVLGGATDTILDLKILANRPDYMSYVSVAREIAAVLNQDFVPPLKFETDDSSDRPAPRMLTVAVKDAANCPRYIGRVVGNITVQPSPEWMQTVLLASGLRPINNIVDVANYVMLELGQPIHAFDYDKISGGQIVVRPATSKESLTGLDGISRKLDSETLVIADATRPLAIAGVIGGLESGVTDTTQTIVVEVANFNLVSIRNTSRRLGIRTDASARFERGLDIFLPQMAMARMMALLKEICPECQIAHQDIDIHSALPPKTTTLQIEIEAVNRLLGTDLGGSEMAEILTRLDLPTQAEANQLVVEVPHYRSDIQTVSDIAEEVIRIYGIDKIMPLMPMVTLELPSQPMIRSLSRQTRELLIRMGLTEVYTQPFDLGSQEAVALTNPLTTTATHLKTGLVEGLAALEINRPTARIFELNTAFKTTKDVLPSERQELVIRIHEPNAYRVVRGIADELLSQWGIVAKWREVPGLVGLRLIMNREVLGEVIERNRDGYLIIDLTGVALQANLTRQFRPLPKYPAIKVDLAFFIPDRIRVGEMIDDIFATDPLVDKVELFDIFRSPERGRSVAFHIELVSSIRTLTKADRDRVVELIQNTLLERHKAKLRDE